MKASASRKKLILLVAALVLMLAALVITILVLGSRSPAAGTDTTPGSTTLAGTSTAATTGSSADTTAAAQSAEPEQTTAPAQTAEPQQTSEPEQTSPVQTDPPATQQPQATGISYPRSLSNGQLALNSLFQFTGFNPDNGNAEGENVAAIQLKNVSGQHLSSATVTMTLSNGKTARFLIRDLPAGMSVMAFSDSSVTISDSDVCTGVSCEASFESGTPVMSDKLTVSIDGTAITVTNISGENLTNLVVHCHCLLGTDCYGGLTYSYPIDSLSAGASTTILAWDCLLGGAEVVRIGSPS